MNTAGVSVIEERLSLARVLYERCLNPDSPAKLLRTFEKYERALGR